MIKKVLVLGPHTDDGELGCGGTINRFIEEGVEVFYATFSCAEESVPDGFPKDILETEVKNASRVLGIKSENLFIHKYRVRYFPKYRQEILEDLVKLKLKINPDLVLLPNSDDIHQDHHTIHQEAIRAFKHCKLLGYELPWNNLKFTSNFHIALEERHLDKKAEAMKEYKSQNFRNYVGKEFLLGLARVRGIQIKTELAESFETIRWHL